MSMTAVSKLNSEDEYAEITIPILPLDLGNITEAEVGVILNPVPSAPMLELSEQYTVEDPALGFICALTSYPVKLKGVEGDPVLYSNLLSYVFPCLITKL